MSLPSVIGDYAIIDRIAVGGMAEIFLAKRVGPERFEKAVVIKRLLPDLAKDSHFTDMFLDEARLAAMLNHAHIVQIYDLGKIDNSFYIAMEYLIGEDLASTIVKHINRRTRLTIPLAAKIIAESAEGLHYAHSLLGQHGEPLNIVHRDVSPSNIVITRQGHVKVVDFGIAKAAGRSAKTQTGVVKGKLSYMAPEQVRGHDVDHRADIYALGVTLFETISCTRMYQGLSEMDLFRAIADGVVPSLKTRVPEVPDELDAIVRKALAFDLSERYATAAQMQNDLLKFLVSQGHLPSSTDLGDMLIDLFGAEYFEKMERRQFEKTPIAPSSTTASEVGTKTLDDHDRTVPEERMVGSGDVVIESLAARPRRGFLTAVGVLVGATILGAGGFAAWTALTPPVAAQVTSEPAGATVFVNGVRVADQTPAMVDDLRVGREYLVRLELEGHEPWERSFVPAQSATSRRVNARLSPRALSVLRVETNPRGARVYVDGRVIEGKTPLTISRLEPGRDLSVLVERAGYRPVERTVKIEAGLERLELELVTDDGAEGVKPTNKTTRSSKSNKSGKPKTTRTNKAPKSMAGTLSLTSNVELIVKAGTKTLGRTPLSDVAMPTGSVTLELVEPRTGMSRNLPITIAGPTSRAVQLSKGKLTVAVKPWADIYVGGRKLGTTPLINEPLWEGTYTVVLKNADLGATKKVRVEIQAGQTARVKETLP